MHKLLLLTTLGATLLFTGCSKVTAFDFFSTDPYYEKAVTNMKTISLTQAGETKVLLHAVYLNNVDPQTYNGNDYFFVAIHIIDEAHSPKDSGLMNPAYKLEMVEKINIGYHKSLEARPLEIRALREEDKLTQSMPIKSKWNYFYLVRYEAVNDTKLNLIFKTKKFGNSSISFQKKEVLTHSNNVF